jgi:soluble lytic murein transglycosylase
LLLVLLPAVAFAKPKPKVSGKPPKVAQPKRADAVAVEKLGAGYRAFSDGNYGEARKILGAVDRKLLRNPDYALYFLGQAELLDDQAKSARKHFAELAGIGGRFGNIARWRLADSDWALGKLDDATKEYTAALSACGGDKKCDPMVDPAVARARLADVLSSKKSPGAETAWRRIYIDWPSHPLAEKAATRMGKAPLTVDEKLNRARTLLAARRWTEAKTELDEVPEDSPLKPECEFVAAMAQFKTRHAYTEAAERLNAIWSKLSGEEHKADALFHAALARSRSEANDEAIVAYRLFGQKFPHSRFAPEASFRIGSTEFNRGNYKAAIPGFEDTLKKFGKSTFADDARWYLGFSRWLSGDTAGALEDFLKLAQMKGGQLVGGKGLYWAGRAYAELGRTDEAIATWKRIPENWPFGWYSQLARARLAERKADTAPIADTGSVPKLGKLDATLAKDPLIGRVDELLAAGMTVEAGVELQRGESDFQKRAGPRALPALFDRYSRGDNFYRMFRLAEAKNGGAMRVNPRANEDARVWWQLVYPLAWRAFVEKYAPSGDNPPYYLYTIMQKESAYNPHDVSYADAIGLLQMIPPTSRNVATHVGQPYTDDVLYDPEGNIRFGAWYIGHLLSKFKKQIPIGAGSFNAGPRAMRGFLGKNGKRPLDEFVELCPYSQTREYMKKATDIYAHYVWLYAGEDYLPPKDVDPEPLEDGIDY